MSRQVPIMVKCEVVDLSIAASKKMPDEIEVEASGDFRIHDGDERPTGLEGLIELRGMDDTYYSVSMRVQAAFSFADDWNKESRRAYLASDAAVRVFDFARSYLAQVTACFPHGSIKIPPISLSVKEVESA